MTTTEELEARIEKLENIIYDRIVYPQIVRERKHPDPNKQGIPLRSPEDTLPDAHLLMVLNRGSGYIDTTFRKDIHGKVGDLFYAAGQKWKITHIEPISLWRFVKFYYSDGGFGTMEEACDYYGELYFGGSEFADIGAAAAAFKTLNGYKHDFVRYAKRRHRADTSSPRS